MRTSRKVSVGIHSLFWKLRQKYRRLRQGDNSKGC